MVDGPRRSFRPSPATGLLDPEHDLAGALHDVSNELTVVIGWLERALEQMPHDATMRQALDIAFQRALRGRAIARQAIGASSPPSANRATRIKDLLETAAVGVSPQSTAAAVSLVAEVPLDLDDVLVEHGAVVLQILTNLLLNAIAFSPPNSTVRTVVQQRENDLFFRVCDEGPGLSEEQRTRLFLDVTSTRKGGTGVGLKHASALARHHQGALGTEPATVGACFVLRWPFRAVSADSALLKAGGLLDGQRVLVIEDDEAVLSLLQTTLEARGAQVWCVRSATELVSLPASPLFTAALVDLSPLGDDVETHLTTLRALHPNLRVVLTSGSAFFSVSEDAWGAFCWVRKPFEISEIVEALTRLRRSLLTGRKR